MNILWDGATIAQIDDGKIKDNSDLTLYNGFTGSITTEGHLTKWHMLLLMLKGVQMPLSLN